MQQRPISVLNGKSDKIIINRATRRPFKQTQTETIKKYVLVLHVTEEMDPY